MPEHEKKKRIQTGREEVKEIEKISMKEKSVKQLDEDKERYYMTVDIIY